MMALRGGIILKSIQYVNRDYCPFRQISFQVFHAVYIQYRVNKKSACGTLEGGERKQVMLPKGKATGGRRSCSYIKKPAGERVNSL